jgi:hypothetical protein
MIKVCELSSYLRKQGENVEIIGRIWKMKMNHDTWLVILEI